MLTCPHCRTFGRFDVKLTDLEGASTTHAPNCICHPDFPEEKLGEYSHRELVDKIADGASLTLDMIESLRGQYEDKMRARLIQYLQLGDFESGESEMIIAAVNSIVEAL